MVMTWTLTIVGFFCIFAHADWNLLEKPHHLVGIVSVVLCFIQPFMALLRPHPGDPNRPIFNWVHWGVGTAAHCLASEPHPAFRLIRKHLSFSFSGMISLRGSLRSHAFKLNHAMYASEAGNFLRKAMRNSYHSTFQLGIKTSKSDEDLT